MAKIKIELELDFLVEEDEEFILEDEVKREIFSNIETRIISTIKEKLTKEAEQRIGEKIDKMTTEAVKERIESYLSKPKTITDKYGDVIKEDITVESLLKENIDTAMSKKTLDQNGKHSNYGQRFSLFEFLAIENIETLINAKINEVVPDVKKQIESTVKEKIKTSVADNLTDFILKNSSHPLVSDNKV
jgi:uncharacterized membrane protein YheB (UPF0754 family)